ncbi:DNA repair protein, putative [Candida dubliniensis CD36]|uniref:G/U mismatch-specific uracil DNA glycosylase, putative n=1 Tax=Candida dubliniensis (strain CD36 / ATCC MYA-646 / CBS 7987 / NCPF 3949 / NRRL Y-17841) TaxID=573826 RepID=B9WEN4_CANDC|nr:DNA repair protein, putative [Candida dubliniensis CD36]CAX43146.1 DNA repair protein, putative [Candida dubliniensis CD36]
MTKNLDSFRYTGTQNVDNNNKPYRITKLLPKLKTKRRIETKSSTNNQKLSVNLPDLKPSLNDHLQVLFVGFNPGTESAIQQHHYAHHSNLFWKLFNQSQLLHKVISKNNQQEEQQIVLDDSNDQFLNHLLENGCNATHDFKLIKYNIGFSDLVLRSTARADQLTISEKLENVPRLLSEFKSSRVETIVIVGKGIWEIIVKYFMKELNISSTNFKLTSSNSNRKSDGGSAPKNFEWGLLQKGSDLTYNLIIDSIYKHIDESSKIYILPNTSGLVASLSFDEKLKLWQDMVNDL